MLLFLNRNQPAETPNEPQSAQTEFDHSMRIGTSQTTIRLGLEKYKLKFGEEPPALITRDFFIDPRLTQNKPESDYAAFKGEMRARYTEMQASFWEHEEHY